MAQPGRSSKAFPDLGSKRLKHRRVVCLKFTPPLDWRSTLDATPTRFHGLGEWNGNDNDSAFPMVGVPAYLSRSRTGLTRDGCAECLPAKGGVIVLLGRSNLQRRKSPLEQPST